MERWVTYANHLAWEMKSSPENQECCCAYNMMKLTRQLYGWQPQIRHVEYFERNLLNHRLGTIEPKTGHTTYFLSMAPGAWKTLGTEENTFWCCNGTALEEFAKLQDSIYFHDADSLYVNLYVASNLEWKDRGVRLKQETEFPNEPRTRLTVVSTPAEAWTMHLRIPAWTSREARVTVNGRPVDVQPEGPGCPVQVGAAQPGALRGHHRRGYRRLEDDVVLVVGFDRFAPGVDQTRLIVGGGFDHGEPVEGINGIRLGSGAQQRLIAESSIADQA